MAVHAHPDDESITTGGTLARCAAEGMKSLVQAISGHDRS
jgi:LmbE family N-acetylglucosaminyl deacetylase